LLRIAAQIAERQYRDRGLPAPLKRSARAATVVCGGGIDPGEHPGRDFALFCRTTTSIVIAADSNVAHKAKPSPGIGLYDCLPVTAISHSLASRIDAAGQGRIGNNTAIPNARDQIVLGHHPIAILHQVDQHVENLWFERDLFRASPELSPFSVQDIVAKNKLHEKPQ